jgi:LysR family cys regulon transcriptional activator
MKLRQLQCLCAVVDAGFNISRASEVLNTTQPAVGKQLRQLEEELDADFFIRQGGRLLGLTEAGGPALGWARRALQCTDNLKAAVQQSDDERGGTIDIATSHTYARYILLPTILSFAHRFPLVRIALQQGPPEQVAALVRDGKATVGVIHMPPEVPNEVVALPFMSIPQALALPAGHPLIDEPDLTLEKLAAFPLIIQSPARPQGARILRVFEQAGLQVNLSVQALDADVMKAYVAAGLGISIIPAFIYSPEHDHGLRTRDIAHLFPPVVSAVLLRRRSFMRPSVYAFLERMSPELHRHRIEGLVFEHQ